MSTGKQRLHPLSPVLNGIKSLGVVMAAISWQGFAQFGVTTGGMIVAAGGVLGLIWAWIAWRFTGFEIADRELRISEGALMRRHRTIPLQRLQSVEVVQPLLARPVGLAQLRCEVVGAAKTEAPLSFLTLKDATELRERLLTLSKQSATASSVATDDATDPDATAEPTVVDTAPVEEATPVLTVPSGLLLRSQLLTPQVFALPFAVAVTVVFFVVNPDATFFGIAALISALLGILLSPVRQAMGNYDFTLTETDTELLIRRGLTERRTQTLPHERVTAVTIQRPLLWRWAGWVTCRVANAGGGSSGSEQLLGGTLLPVGTHEQARTVTTHALSGVDLTAVRLIGVPRRARWRSPIGQPALGAGLGEQVFVCRRGRVIPQLVAVPYARIQSVRVTQGRWQRALRLATVSVDIAGGIGINPRASHRDLDEALDMALRLRERSREAARPQPSS
ncbi:PH domain-containing protein [Stackebrandtia nassauensis]|uniref:Membrane-flanked domain protein n=1 Tax=Stackebrandtia nassauensis (strain DSM 44728 / CIP 108903 / NRRL B-16338 / NBRC 102104 / LLR-40K-21) TaxID=446470 RepID=D3Q4Z3_STANL|nr:PH domain-containing protein [Stackebrandtia nassauensis]ADD42173.1 membrane-flanked domain protein [Stackebrandtia nassauensis DSM 44728]